MCNYAISWSMEILTQSEKDTARVAQDLALRISERECICLYGDLGAGKTVFARALIRALMQDPDIEVPSPTFTLLQTYEAPRSLIWHYDLYRMEHPEDVYELSWEEALFEGLVIVEWPARLSHLLPQKRLDITLSRASNDPDGSQKRVIHIEEVGS